MFFLNAAYRLVAVGLVVEHGRSLGSVAPGLHGPKPHLVLWETLQRISGWILFNEHLTGMTKKKTLERKDFQRRRAVCLRKKGGRVEDESHHGLGQVLDKLLQRGALQDLEDGVLDLLLVIHVVALMTAELVLGHHLAEGSRKRCSDLHWVFGHSILSVCFHLLGQARVHVVMHSTL